MFIPSVLDKDGARTDVLDLYSKFLRNRVILVTGPIEPMMATAIKTQLLYLESENPTEDIVMYIDSVGGEVATGLGIYDTMQYVKPDIQTICMGLGASMGSLLLAGGTKGKRFALKNAHIMLHQPSGSTSGKASDMAIDYEHIRKVKDVLRDIYVRHTGQSKETIEKLLDRDTWLFSKEAKSLGLIDDILER